MEQAGVRMLHFDVMDGCFAPMMTFGPALIGAVQTSLFKDVHLMIRDPLEKIEAYAAAGADMITVHVESCTRVRDVLQAMGKLSSRNAPERSLRRGVAISPGTSVEVLLPLLDEVDAILVLAVYPGLGGQRFIPSTRQRLASVREMIRQAERDILLGVDGGINRSNIAEVAALGPDIIVTGSAVFDGKDPAANARFMLKAVCAVRTD
jgi:ribulose-phosphate 3-epimerase